jgi:hypothetical protein
MNVVFHVCGAGGSAMRDWSASDAPRGGSAERTPVTSRSSRISQGRFGFESSAYRASCEDLRPFEIGEQKIHRRYVDAR